jgi:DeoR/GlpR family transcriptional regulator of sugar metabolism
MKIDRLNAIRSHLYANGPTSITELAKAIGASLPTIRRDLQALEEANVIDRVHGGAQIARGSTVELDFEMREQQHLAAKRAIATSAYKMLRPRSAVFLDAGTTVFQVARRLRLDPQPLDVFTNGLTVANELFNVPTLKIFMLGGFVRSENASTVGAQAELQLQSLWFDTLVLGAGAITMAGEICSIDGSEASLNMRMLERSTTRLILADASKFGTTATFTVAKIPAGATIVTDSSLSSEWRQRIVDWALELVVAEPGVSEVL